MVGLPCHLHSIRNVQQFNTYWETAIKPTIGLFCDRTLAFSGMDYLISQSKLPRKKVKKFIYKDRTKGKFPGNVCITSNTNELVQLPSNEREEIKDYFTPSRCRLCFDKMNVLSDIALGDAWGVKEKSEGYSVLLARTTDALSLIEAAVKAEYLKLEKVSSEQIFTGQHVELRRRQWTAFTKARQNLKNYVPDFGIDGKYEDINISGIRDFVMGQIRWQDTHFKTKTSNQIVRAVKIDKILRKIKNKIGL